MSDNTAIAVIRGSCLKAQAAGIRIEKGGALFDWCGTDNVTPKSCSALGAVLWSCDRAHSEHIIKDLCALLSVDSFWLWRFMMGFDRNHQLYILDPETEKIIGEDDVSKLGKKLVKEFVRP